MADVVTDYLVTATKTGEALSATKVLENLLLRSV